MTTGRVLSGLILAGAISVTGPAQAPAAPAMKLPEVPTTHVLAIGRLTTGTTQSQVAPFMKQEVPDTVRLYLAGKLEQWYVRKDQPGVVFLLHVTTTAEAHELLERLPLGQAKLMEFDLIPLGPLSPLGLLLQGGGPAAP